VRHTHETHAPRTAQHTVQVSGGATERVWAPGERHAGRPNAQAHLCRATSAQVTGTGELDLARKMQTVSSLIGSQVNDR